MSITGSSNGRRPEDGVPDMTVISDIDENGINTNLKVRYDKDEIYTYTGTILVAVNPYKELDIYDLDWVFNYNGQKIGHQEPHVFAISEAAYSNLQNKNLNQSCVISGESGAGKTETTKFILQYLCTVTSTVSTWVEQQIIEANTILEAFGNAKTVRNDNSSRFGKFIQICFDAHYQIKGCIIQDYLLEQSRITFQSVGERNYHVFYQVVAAAQKNDEFREQFMITSAESYNYLNQSGCTTIGSTDDATMFDSLRLAMSVLNVPSEMSDGIFGVLSAILWLGNLQFSDLDGEKCQLTPGDEDIVMKVSTLLGVDPEGFSQLCLHRQIIVRGNVTEIPFKLHEAQDNRNAMAKALYSRTFAWIVSYINKCTNPGKDSKRFLGVLDIFGFENFAMNSFEQLCINYTNEKLHKFFNHYVFTLEQEIYKQEEITFSHITFTDNTECLELLEKAPKCILRLLTEECRIPKGTDISYVNKLHQEFASHPNYVRGDDRRRWDIEFGVNHYAGEVVYTVDGFLEKNKDVQQDQLFDLMQFSSNALVKDLTNFQDLLGVKVAALGDGKSTISRTITKGRPTVADAFRYQLTTLVDVLHCTDPWYVRCIKPNQKKSPNYYDSKEVLTQLKYLGMVDIIRIRKEGFPVHFPFSDFIQNYRCLVSKVVLSKDPQEAVATILKSLRMPEMEWQIGKTKVFLRNSVYDPLEDQRKALTKAMATVIQNVWRGFVQRRAFLQQRTAALVIQRHFSGRRQRLYFLRMRRAAVTIQAYVRGMFAREVAATLREMKRREDEERRKQLEEEERLRLEAERQSLEEEERKAVEKAVKETQDELVTITSLVEKNVQRAQETSDVLDLDEMFSFLSSVQQQEVTVDELMNEISDQMDALLKDVDENITDWKQKEDENQKKSVIEQVQKNEDPEREIRRKQRVEKRLNEIDAQEKGRQEDEVEGYYDMIEFAEKYFNDHLRDVSGTMMRTLTRRRKSSDSVVPKYEMVTYTSSCSIPTSHIHIYDFENISIACTIFKDLCKYLRGDLKNGSEIQTIQTIIAYGIDRDELRDEIFVQLIRQITNNPCEDAILRGWVLLCLSVVAFHPSKTLFKYFISFLKKAHSQNSSFAWYTQWCLDNVNNKKTMTRQLPPSSMEIIAIRNKQTMVCRFYFMDLRMKAIEFHPRSTAADAIQILASKIGLKSVEGWALFEKIDNREHIIKGHEYLADVITHMELSKQTSFSLTKYATLSRKGPKSAPDSLENYILFRRRLFWSTQEIPQDAVEVNLLYAQAVHNVVKEDKYPLTEKVALQLAGLQTQIDMGEPKNGVNSYADVERYLNQRICKTKMSSEWIKDIAEAHQVYGSGKSEVVAKVWYLSVVMQYPLYGTALFHVVYKGYLIYGHELLLGVNAEGILIVKAENKSILNGYRYCDLESVLVDPSDNIISINILKSLPDLHKCLSFETSEKHEIASLIASYSPAHASWLKPMYELGRRVKLTFEDRKKLHQDVIKCRQALVESGILQKPQEEHLNIFKSTLRRLNRNKIEKLRQEYGNTETFPHAYWTFTKSVLSQSLMTMRESDTEASAVDVFSAILAYSGLLANEVAETTISREKIAHNILNICMKKDALVNELFLQLIKQTTDHPEPNSRGNLRHWQLLSLACSVIFPTNKEILSYLQAHLRKCTIDDVTEEGQFAQFAYKSLMRTLETRGRKWPPSSEEVTFTISRRPIHAHVYFLDGQRQTADFDPCASVKQVLEKVKDKIGLRKGVQGYALYGIMGSGERALQNEDKLADIMSMWDKVMQGKGSNSKQCCLMFKKHLLLDSYIDLSDPVEKELLYHQVMHSIRNNRFPITSQEAVMLCAIKAQQDFGDYQQGKVDYRSLISGCLPPKLQDTVSNNAVETQHQILAGMDSEATKQAFLSLVQSWSLHKAAIFDVTQTYTSSWPKNLWLAVDQVGVHLLEPNTRNILCTCEYEVITNYSPSLNSLMIVVCGGSKTVRYIFTTNQVTQIAHLIRDYIDALAAELKAASVYRRRRGQVEEPNYRSHHISVLYKPSLALPLQQVV
ncbi:unconventional myosin-VIIa-like isoform X2 [Tachypleus tridentatus]|uniref:unconventional myosin-VIIa-like isoform X2 n=1 Tax=Tachypleus tridentatus TaxID=6853 RepID=UPI003FD03737